MALNYNTIRTTFYNWASLNVPMGMPVIYYQPNAPRPLVPYVTLYLNVSNQVNQDYVSPGADAGGNVFMRGDRQLVLQVQAYGNDPETVLENLRSSLNKETVGNILHAGGVSYLSTLAMNDITDLVDSQFERRAMMDLNFSVGQFYSDNPGYFDHLEVQEIYLDPAAQIVYDEIINIPEL